MFYTGLLKTVSFMEKRALAIGCTHLRNIHPGVPGFVAYLCSTIAILMLAGQSHGAIWTVVQGGSIQEAIDSAAPGDTILVSSGIYKENVIASKQIRLLGSDTGFGLPVVEANGTGSAITFLANGALVEGLKATGSGRGPQDAGILLLSGSNSVKGCEVILNGNCGILLIRSDKNIIEDNNISKNQAGVRLQLSTANTIRSNNVTANLIGIDIISHNDTEAIRKDSGIGGVSIKYKPKGEASSYNVSRGFTSQTNVLYNNSLLENGQNARDDGLNNQWDSGLVGNHYSSFDARDEGCKDRNRDGICDFTYFVPGGSGMDRFPKASSEAAISFRARGKDGAQLTLDKGSYPPGSAMIATYKTPGGKAAGIGVAGPYPSATAAIRSAQGYRSVNSSSEAKIIFQAPQAEGSYLFLMWNESAGDLLVSLAFQVAAPSLNTSVQSVRTCDRISASYSGAPGFEGDWVGLYTSGAPDGMPIDRQYLDGSQNGSLVFYAPSTGGSYNLRLFEDNGYNLLATSLAIEVKPTSGIHVEASPAEARVGEPITVTFWGGPDSPDGIIKMYYMTRPDKFHIDGRALNGRRCGIITFVPPGPGTYDFRMFENDVYRKLMGQSNAVNVR